MHESTKRHTSAFASCFSISSKDVDEPSQTRRLGPGGGGGLSPYSSTVISHYRPSSVERLNMIPDAQLGSELIGFTKDAMIAASISATGDMIAQYSEFQKRVEQEKEIMEDEEELYNIQNDILAAMNDGSSTLSSALSSPSSSSSVFEVDTRRTLSYAAFGGIYTGGFQHVVFSGLQDAIPDPVTRVAVNQGLIIPLVYYPFFYWLVPKLRARTTQERKELRGNIDIVKVLPRNWLFWIPLQFLQFNFIPLEFQVTYISAVGLMWNTLLSMFTSGGQSQQEEEELSQRPQPLTSSVEYNPPVVLDGAFDVVEKVEDSTTMVPVPESTSAN